LRQPGRWGFDISIEGSSAVASKDKGGKAEKKEPKKNLKEKRAAKKAKKK
jgi:hypothetical protein